MAGSPPNLHTMDSRSACIQNVVKVKVKGHVIRALLWWQENGFFSRANGLIATKIAHDGHQVSLHSGCAQGQCQGQRSRDTRTFLDSWNELLRHWRSGWLCLFVSIDVTVSIFVSILWTRKRVPNDYERCSSSCCCWGCCYQIFNVLKRFHFATDHNETSAIDWWWYCRFLHHMYCRIFKLSHN